MKIRTEPPESEMEIFLLAIRPKKGETFPNTPAGVVAWSKHGLDNRTDLIYDLAEGSGLPKDYFSRNGQS